MREHLRNVIAPVLCFLVLQYLLYSPASKAENAVSQAQPQLTPLVTGNGHGFAVVSAVTGKLSKFYAHPYKFERADPSDNLSEGIETSNFIKEMDWRYDASKSREDQNRSDVAYRNQSHIINVSIGDRVQSVFMPFGIQRNALFVTSTDLPSGEHCNLAIKWDHKIKTQKAVEITTKSFGTSVQAFSFEGVNETLFLIPLNSRKRTEITSSKPAVPASADITMLSGASAWILLSLENEKNIASALFEIDSWRSKLDSAALLARELKQVEEWRVKPKVRFQSREEKLLWRQSEVVLRMAQILEVGRSERHNHRLDRHNHGLIIASLPDGAWFVPWVRDMAYAADALIKMGHQKESRWALEGFLNARPVGRMQKEVGGLPYQISVVRYFGDGAEEPYFTMEGSNNIEFDNWGLALWILGEYVEHFRDYKFLSVPTYRGSVYENTRDYIVKPLLANLEPYEDGLIVAADTSIWEERQRDKKHFAYSTITAIVGLESFSRLALKQGDATLNSELEKKIALLKKGFNKAFIKDGKLRGALEDGIKNEVDGAMLSAINFGLVEDPSILKATAAAMERHKMPSGGYKRVTSIIEDPAIFEYWYERQEFLFINFSLAEVYLRLHDKDKAEALFSKMLERSAKDNYFIPEMYVSEKNYRFTGEIGDPTGAVPMVGYGAGVYISYLLNRQALSKRNH